MTLAHQPAPSLPFPLFKISQNVNRYMLYDVTIITWLRKTHNILGVLVGTLSQLPQQNLFLGLPLELLPEEARFLIETGLAFAVDDLAWHAHDGISIDVAQRNELKARLRQEGMEVAEEVERMKTIRSHRRRETAQNQKSIKPRSPEIERNIAEAKSEPLHESLFDDTAPLKAPVTPPQVQIASIGLEPYSITPVASYPMLLPPRPGIDSDLPQVDRSSYALFKHLHSLGYFMTPGLRFGCRFSVYPGDPLRFHSHFLALSSAWDEEIDLLHLIGGGRLGTGVKKGWLVGGIEEDGNVPCVSGSGADSETSSVEKTSVRAFCLEWGGM